MFVLLFGIIAFAAVQGSKEREPCWTPSLAQGVCISIHECAPLLNLLEQSVHLEPRAKALLRNSHCGYEDNSPKVCCPTIVMMSRSRPDISFTATSPIHNNVHSVEVSYGPPDVRNHPKLGLINHEMCGPITQSKIIAGNRTALFEFPWMALLAYNVNERQTDFKCGGSLINKRYVLTAAHCVIGLDPGIVLAGVRIGEHDLSKEIDCEVEDGEVAFCADKYQNFFIESFHYHGRYDETNHENDIALIRMDGDAEFKSPNIKPICLPVGDSATIRFKNAIVTGWGRTEKGHRSEELLQARLVLVSKDECAAIYEDTEVRISDKQICAGGRTRADSCFGDSGGPLQYPDITDPNRPKYVQYGVVSFGPERCGFEKYPGVYTKITYYMDWILDNIVE